MNHAPLSTAKKGENLTMRALYLMAILFVVDGHTTLGDMFDMDSLFRYYSFHLMLFAFGSGYFFSLKGSFLSDLCRRAKKMLLPLYLWNVVYGVGAAALRRFGGFEFGEPLSAYTLLLAPLLDGVDGTLHSLEVGDEPLVCLVDSVKHLLFDTRPL